MFIYRYKYIYIYIYIYRNSMCSHTSAVASTRRCENDTKRIQRGSFYVFMMTSRGLSMCMHSAGLCTLVAPSPNQSIEVVHAGQTPTGAEGWAAVGNATVGNACLEDPCISSTLHA